MEKYSHQPKPVLACYFRYQDSLDAARIHRVETQFTKNIATGTYSRLLKSTRSQYSLNISGTRIVWMQGTAAGYTIYYKNLSTGISGRLTP